MTILKMKPLLKQVINSLFELEEDITIPRNIKKTIQEIIHALNDDSKISIKVNKALDELEKITDDVNIQSYTRTQLWNIISLLEKVQEDA